MNDTTTPRGKAQPTANLHALGQSLWLDNITRNLLDSGTLRRYIEDFAVTGLTSNPTIFDAAIGKTSDYDAGIRSKAAAGGGGETLFFELALEDLRRAADLFLPVFRATGGADGWVSLEVSPLLANDTAGTLAAAASIHRAADRPNLYVKIPGTPAGIGAIEAAIFAGIPVNVTLLFSREQYVAAAEAYLRGIERRLAAGLSPRVSSVASVFVSRWDVAVAGMDLPPGLRNNLGLAIGGRIYAAYRRLLDSRRWRELAGAGAVAQRLLWASTGTKDPAASPNLYVEGLAAPDTVDTMPEKTLLAFAATGKPVRAMAPDGGDCESLLAKFAGSGVDIDSLALKLQVEGAASFVKSWQELMQVIASKSSALVSP
jgi:transaldolase